MFGSFGMLSQPLRLTLCLCQYLLLTKSVRNRVLNIKLVGLIFTLLPFLNISVLEAIQSQNFIEIGKADLNAFVIFHFRTNNII